MQSEFLRKLNYKPFFYFRLICLLLKFSEVMRLIIFNCNEMTLVYKSESEHKERISSSQWLLQIHFHIRTNWRYTYGTYCVKNLIQNHFICKLLQKIQTLHSYTLSLSIRSLRCKSSFHRSNEIIKSRYAASFVTYLTLKAHNNDCKNNIKEHNCDRNSFILFYFSIFTCWSKHKMNCSRLHDVLILFCNLEWILHGKCRCNQTAYLMAKKETWSSK